MKKNLFQYAILHHNQIKTDSETTVETELIIEPKTVLAKSADQVSILAAREIPEKYLEDLENIDIVVRPF